MDAKERGRKIRSLTSKNLVATLVKIGVAEKEIRKYFNGWYEETQYQIVREFVDVLEPVLNEYRSLYVQHAPAVWETLLHAPLPVHEVTKLKQLQRSIRTLWRNRFQYDPKTSGRITG